VIESSSLIASDFKLAKGFFLERGATLSFQLREESLPPSATSKTLKSQGDVRVQFMPIFFKCNEKFVWFYCE